MLYEILQPKFNWTENPTMTIFLGEGYDISYLPSGEEKYILLKALKKNNNYDLGSLRNLCGSSKYIRFIAHII